MSNTRRKTDDARAIVKGVASVIDIAGVGFVGYRIPQRRKTRNQVLAARWRKIGDRLNATIESASPVAKPLLRNAP